MQMETLPVSLYNITHTGTFGIGLPLYSRQVFDFSQDRTFTFDHTLQPYFGSPQASYRQISFVDVLGMSFVDMMANFRDKYVLIGESGTHINDAKISPVT
jgi:CHASE2 domain-containing sensor protein